MDSLGVAGGRTGRHYNIYPYWYVYVFWVNLLFFYLFFVAPVLFIMRTRGGVSHGAGMMDAQGGGGGSQEVLQADRFFSGGCFER